MSQPPQIPQGYSPQAYSPQGYSPPGYPPQGYSPQAGFWPYYLTPPEALLGPARRASIMLFVFGALLLAAGSCVGIGGIGATDDMLVKAIDQMREMNPQQPDIFTPHSMRILYGVMAAMLALCAFVAIALGVFVRSGSRASSITSLVIVILPVIGILLLLLSAVFAGPTPFVATLLVMLFPLVLIAMTVNFLIGAIRAAPQVDAARRQLLMAHQQHQAQYHAYAQQYQNPPVQNPPV